MYELKTTQHDGDVIAFIEAIESAEKKKDAYALLHLFCETSGLEAKMWGPSIIGFGSYHYKYASGHEGDAALVGFSPRKAKISLYLAPYDPMREELLSKLGKHTTGVGCVYIKKVQDIDTDALRTLILRSIEYLRNLYPSVES